MEKKIEQIEQYQTLWVKDWHDAEPKTILEGFLGLVQNQHLQNYRLWHKEDQARIPDVDDKVIAAVKRDIDQLNQKRNDLIEKLDEYIISWLHQQGIIQNDTAPQNSETPGSIIDRCSILALKIYHMQEEVDRKDAEQEHKDKARDKVAILKEQRTDLFVCLDSLFREVMVGTRIFKIYRQFKMYNDPTLNPQIYSRKKNT